MQQVGRFVEVLLRRSRERRAQAEAAREEIAAAEERVRRGAQEALEVGLTRHLGACGVPEAVLEALRGPQRDTPAMQGVQRWLASDKPICILTGGVGAGKTVAAATVLRQATRWAETLAHPLSDEPVRFPVYDARRGLFITAAQLRVASRYVEGREASLLDRAATVAWLVLDELRPADLAGAGLQRLEEVLGERYAMQRRTVITTNSAQEVLAGELSERLKSRFAEGAMVIDAGDLDLRRARR